MRLGGDYLTGWIRATARWCAAFVTEEAESRGYLGRTVTPLFAATIFVSCFRSLSDGHVSALLHFISKLGALWIVLWIWLRRLYSGATADAEGSIHPQHRRENGKSLNLLGLFENHSV